jgi:hypothetical protein
MWLRRRKPSAGDEVVIDLRERLEPYSSAVPNPAWRKSLADADAKRRNRPLRAKPRHLAP